MEKELNGIRGWLLVVAVLVIMTPIRLLSVEIPQLNELLNSDTWVLLTSPGSEAYHSFWAPFLIIDVIFHLALLVASLYLIQLFFSKDARFPKAFITLTLVSLAYLLFASGVHLVLAAEPAIVERNFTIDIVRSLLGAAIWIPYMLVSKRVQNTFRPKPN